MTGINRLLFYSAFVGWLLLIASGTTALCDDYTCIRCHLSDEVMRPQSGENAVVTFWINKNNGCPGLYWINRENSVTRYFINSLRHNISLTGSNSKGHLILKERLDKIVCRYQIGIEAPRKSANEAAIFNAEIREELDRMVLRPILAEIRKKELKQVLLSIAAGLLFIGGAFLIFNLKKRGSRAKTKNSRNISY